MKKRPLVPLALLSLALPASTPFSTPVLAQAPVAQAPVAQAPVAQAPVAATPLSLSGRSVPAGPGFTIGRGRYVLSSGTLQEVLGGDGRPAGYLFRGSGTLTWSSEDAEAMRVYQRNAKRVGDVKVAADGQLTYAFSRALFLASDALRGQIPAAAGSTEAGAPAPGASASGGVEATSFAQLLEELDLQRVPSVEPALVAAGSAGRCFGAFLDDRVHHLYDDVFDAEESVLVTGRPSGLPIGFPKWRFVRRIAREPIGRTRRQPDRARFQLVHLDLDVREGEKPWGRIAVEEKLVAEEPLSTVQLELNSEELSPHAFKILPTRILSVTDGTGAPLTYTFGMSRLTVRLRAPVARGAAFTLRFEYEAPFFERYGGDNLWELPLGSGWYPEPLSATEARHTVHTTIRARKPLVPFTSGDIVRREEDGVWNLVETRLDRPVRFVAALAGKYSVVSETEDGVTCHVAAYGVAKDMSGRKLTNIFHAVRKHYEKFVGTFPWKDYSIVEINNYGFGQAPPGMMRITQEAFQSNIMTEQMSRAFSGGINHRVAHEVAHSYFGNSLWAASPSEQWLEESLSEVVSAYVIELLKSKSEAKIIARRWASDAKDATKTAPIYLANELARKFESDSDTAWDRTGLIYDKGASVFDALRKELGDDLLFFTVIRSFHTNFAKKPVTTTDFIALLNFVTKKEWTPWFEKYYWGREMP